MMSKSQDNPRQFGEGAGGAVVMLTCLSCIGGFLFGYDTGIISGALVLISDKFQLEEWEKELIVSLTVVGALVSAASCGYFIDKLGRKRVILVSSALFGIGALCMAVTPNLTMLMVGRFLVGLGVGSGSMSVPVYMSEVADTEIRGTLITCINVAITGGQFISCLIAGGFSYVNDGWRYMLGIALLPALVQFVGFLYMPESPRWLVEHGRREEAYRALLQIGGDENKARAECSNMVNAKHSEASGNSVFKDGMVRFFMRDSPTRRALILGCALQASQQFGGINTIMYYSATILKIAGFSDPSDAIWLASAVSFCNLLGSFLGLYLVDRSGRRMLTLFSLGAVVMALLALSFAFYAAQHQSQQTDVDADYGSGATCDSYVYCFDCVQNPNCGFCTDLYGGSGGSGGTGKSACISKEEDDDAPLYPSLCSSADFHGDSCPGSATIGWVIFTGMCLYLLVFSPGMGPMPWCLNSEIYCTEARGLGNSLSTTVNWTSNLIMSMTFLTLSTALSPQGAFMMYAVISLGFLVFFFFYLPETRGVPLENTILLFEKENWGRAYGLDRMSDASSFLQLDDDNSALLGEANKIDVAVDNPTLLIRESIMSESSTEEKKTNPLHNNEPPEDDFMYHSITSNSAANKLILAGLQDETKEGKGKYQRSDSERGSITSL